MTDDHLLSLIGLALRGSRLAVGEQPVADACLAGKAKLVLTACDAADNTVSRAQREAERANVPHISLPRTRQALGYALGRNLCAVAAVTDCGLAAALAAKLAAEDETFLPLAETLQKEAKSGTGKRTDRMKRNPRSSADRSI